MATSPRAADVSPARSRQRGTELQPSFTESRPGNQNGSRPSADQIAQRAYELYVARGRGDGSDVDDWLEAERELTGSTVSPDKAVSPDNTGAAERDVNSDEAA